MPAQHGTILVIGSGPGIGRNVAQRFASNGFQQVILLSRNADRLKEDATFVTSVAPSTKVHTVTADLVDQASVKKALAEVDSHLGTHPLQAVFYNAARVGLSKFFEWDVEELEKDLAVTVTSLYVIASWAFPKLTSFASTSAASSGKAGFFVTSGLLCKEPFPQLFSLSTCKAAQHNLVHSLWKEFGPRGVHAGLVVIGGVVSDKAKVTTAAKVGEEVWGLFTSEKGSDGKWKLDVILTDPDYDGEVRSRERAGETW